MGNTSHANNTLSFQSSLLRRAFTIECGVKGREKGFVEQTATIEMFSIYIALLVFLIDLFDYMTARLVC